ISPLKFNFYSQTGLASTITNQPQVLNTNSSSSNASAKTLNFINIGEAIAQDKGKTIDSKTVNTSIYSFTQALFEIFVGLIEKNKISRIFVINSSEELLGSSALVLDSTLRAVNSPTNLPIDKIMAFVQASIGAVLFCELISKFSPHKSFLMNLPLADRIGKTGKNLLENFSDKLSLDQSQVMNFLKGSLGLSSLALALSKNHLAKNITNPQQQDAFERSMWIDLICAFEAMLLFIPEGKALSTIAPKLFGGFTKLPGALGKLFGEWPLDSIIEKIYLASSCFKLMADSVPFLLGLTSHKKQED
ncbi:MAG: hypothetical protein SFU25_04040, partial [Candidatus Caenarcaniphilales bacterium]|nr:hypothetical protein [Candidatus Caenarcaniphilales bacterium]